MLDINLLEQSEQWDRLAPEWDALVAAGDNDNPFRGWTWNRAWWTHFGAGRSLAILTAHEHGRLLGVAPLFLDVEHCPFPVRTLRFLSGTDVCSEYLGLLIQRGAEDRVAAGFLEFLFDRWTGNWDVLRWTDIPTGSRQLTVIEKWLQTRSARSFCRDGVTNLMVRLPESWDRHVEGLSSRQRTKMRRVLREFEKRPDLEFEVVEDESQFERCWTELQTLHNRQWASRGQRGCFADPQFNACHTELARGFLRRRMLLLASLRINGTAVSCCYGIRHGDTVYEYQRGHDPALRQMRPGHALQLYLFRQMIGQGARCWDYLRGDYQHKRDWANAQRTTVDLTIPAPRRTQLARLYLERTYRGARSRLGDLRRRFANWLHAS